MAKILVVSVFGRVNADSNDRVNSLYDCLPFEVKIVTTDFSHREKKYRENISSRNVDFLHVWAYRKNLSVARILSHWAFAIRLYFYLKRNAYKYNIVYCITPTPSSAFICAVFKRLSRTTKLIIDVIDVWPEGLIPLGSGYKWLAPVLRIWKWLSVFAYKNADALFAATHSYETQASHYNKRVPSSFFPLGVDADKVNKIKLRSTIEVFKPKEEIWIVYAGNLGNSYDFNAMITAITYVLNSPQQFKLRFVIIGGGDKETELREKLAGTAINYFITGNLEYHDYLNYLSYGDIGLNIYKKDSEVVQSYKFNDYIVSGLFIVNNLKGETAGLIEQYKVGINLNDENNDLNEKLKYAIAHWSDICGNHHQNCKNLITKVLDKNKIYHRMGNEISKLISDV